MGYGWVCPLCGLSNGPTERTCFNVQCSGAEWRAATRMPREQKAITWSLSEAVEPEKATSDASSVYAHMNADQAFETDTGMLSLIEEDLRRCGAFHAVLEGSPPRLCRISTHMMQKVLSSRGVDVDVPAYIYITPEGTAKVFRADEIISICVEFSGSDKGE